MAVLTTKKRKRLRDSTFAVVKTIKGKKIRKYPITDICLRGDMKISLLNGKEVAIRDLVGKVAWVYSYDRKKQAIVPALAKNIRKTGDKAEILIVGLDNDEKVACTPDHPFLLRNGNYCLAKNLCLGSSLMPLYRKINFQQKRENKFQQSELRGYEELWQPWYNCWSFTHHVVRREFNGKALEKGNVIHHIDNNSRNNEPDNLIEMTRSAHCVYHGRLCDKMSFQEMSERSKRRWAKPGAKEKQAKIMILENERRRRCGEMYEIGRKITEIKLKYTKEEAKNAYDMYINNISFDVIAQWWGCCGATVGNRFRREGYFSDENKSACVSNHKVMFVKKGLKAAVYDMEIEKYHNFALSVGVFVHNSHARNALARVAAFGTSAEKAAVKRKVYAKFPSLKKKKK